MPQIPIPMTSARAEQLFNIRITDAPVAPITIVEAHAMGQRGWWARRFRRGWREVLTRLALPAPTEAGVGAASDDRPSLKAETGVSGHL